MTSQTRRTWNETANKRHFLATGIEKKTFDFWHPWSHSLLCNNLESFWTNRWNTDWLNTSCSQQKSWKNARATSPSTRNGPTRSGYNMLQCYEGAEGPLISLISLMKTEPYRGVPCRNHVSHCFGTNSPKNKALYWGHGWNTHISLGNLSFHVIPPSRCHLLIANTRKNKGFDGFRNVLQKSRKIYDWDAQFDLNHVAIVIQIHLIHNFVAFPVHMFDS